MLYELNREDFSRKFQGSLSKLIIEGQDKPLWGTILACNSYSRKVTKCDALVPSLNSNEVISVNITEIINELPENRFYPLRFGEEYVVLTKSFVGRVYVQGVNDQSWTVSSPISGQNYLVERLFIDKPLNIDPAKALKEKYGLITPRIFVKGADIYYLKNLVGKFKTTSQGITCFVDDWIIQEIKDGCRELPMDII